MADAILADTSADDTPVATEIITRAEAKARGLTRYFTGEPCKHGHVAERCTSSASCTVCHRALGKPYREANRDKVCEHSGIRRARKLGQLGVITRGIRAKLRGLQKGKCANCGAGLKAAGEHLDHVIPLALGGLHEDANLQLLCRSCNQRKSAKAPLAFAREQGKLL